MDNKTYQDLGLSWPMARALMDCTVTPEGVTLYVSDGRTRRALVARGCTPARSGLLLVPLPLVLVACLARESADGREHVRVAGTHSRIWGDIRAAGYTSASYCALDTFEAWRLVRKGELTYYRGEVTGWGVTYPGWLFREP
jgi:hypothetical protein